MKLYLNESTDPYFNLAAEEYLLDTEPGEVFMLWRNERAVILGRNQNAYAEINRPVAEERGIAVVRRLTGGGAVFHDLGNLNFTFIVPRERCPELDFARFTVPVAEALKKLGVPAEISGRNDLTADGKKISGNAQCVRGNKVMHHGTLLFSADLTAMADVLRVDPEKMRSKGIGSVRSRVGNLRDWLPDMDVTGFKRYLEESFLSRSGADRAVPFSPEQTAGIERLKREKYVAWAWNWGSSQAYGRTVRKRFPYGGVELSFDSEHGVLTAVRLQGDYFGKAPVDELERALLGCRLLRDELLPRLSAVDRYIHGASPEDIAAMFEL